MNTTILSKEKPPKLERDSRGILITNNLRVCFNRSGDIVIGYINEFKRSDWVKCRLGINDQFWWKVIFELIIQAEDGKISTIRNPNSFIII